MNIHPGWHTQSFGYSCNKLHNRNDTNMNSLTRWQRPVLTTWPGFGRVTDLRDEIDRLFESPLAEMARTSHLLSGWTPVLDLYEDKDNLLVMVELPGMKREDIEVTMHDGSLSISDRKKGEEDRKS